MLPPIALWFAPLPIAAQPRHALAIVLFMVLGWALEALEPGLIGLIGCYLFWALGVVKADVAFGGFSDDTPWFLLGAMLVGLIATKSGLAKRIACSVMLRVGSSYSRLLLGLIIVDALLTFVVPSGVPRVVIMAPIAIGLTQAFGLGKGSNVGRGMLLIVTYAASVFDKTIIAGAATITARGAIERFGHVEVLYGKWLLAYLPADLIVILAAWRLAIWLFPPEKAALEEGSEYLRSEVKQLGPWQPGEKKALFLLLTAIGLWLTDFAHHLPPSMIALGISLAALLPGVRVLETEELKRINYLLLFFVASVASMGKVLAATKSMDVLSSLLFAWITPVLQHPFFAAFGLYWIGFVYHIILASGISMLGTTMPGLMNYATAHHLNPLPLGMVWTFSSGATIFAYQNAVLIVGYAYGYFSAKDLLKFGFWLCVLNSLVLLLVVPLYWPLLGIGG